MVPWRRGTRGLCPSPPCASAPRSTFCACETGGRRLVGEDVGMSIAFEFEAWCEDLSVSNGVQSSCLRDARQRKSVLVICDVSSIMQHDQNSHVEPVHRKIFCVRKEALPIALAFIFYLHLYLHPTFSRRSMHDARQHHGLRAVLTAYGTACLKSRQLNAPQTSSPPCRTWLHLVPGNARNTN